MEKLTMKEKDYLNKIKLLENDRDTWKKACELACYATNYSDFDTYDVQLNNLLQRKMNTSMTYSQIARDYFYQQAQKEMKENE